MKKAVWIPLLATSCTMIGAVAGAFLIMMKREKEMAEYGQMLFHQGISNVRWNAGRSAAEEKQDDTETAE